MFFDINKALCEAFPGLDPIRLLNYPGEDVIDLIRGLNNYGERQSRKKNNSKKTGVIRKPAGDDWF